MINESFCLKCRCEIEAPGICAGCAEVTTEVAFPVFVRQVITKAQKAQSLALARIKQAASYSMGLPGLQQIFIITQHYETQ